jgi:hypothetical protein
MTDLPGAIPIEGHWEDTEPGSQHRSDSRVNQSSFQGCFRAVLSWSHAKGLTKSRRKVGSNESDRRPRSHILRAILAHVLSAILSTGTSGDRARAFVVGDWRELGPSHDLPRKGSTEHYHKSRVEDGSSDGS